MSSFLDEVRGERVLADRPRRDPLGARPPRARPRARGARRRGVRLAARLGVRALDRRNHPVRACELAGRALQPVIVRRAAAGGSHRGLRGRTFGVRCGVRRELHVQAHQGRRRHRGLDDPSQGGLPRAVSADGRPRGSGRDAEHRLMQRLHAERARPRRSGRRVVDVPQRQPQRGRLLAGGHVRDVGDGGGRRAALPADDHARVPGSGGEARST